MGLRKEFGWGAKRISSFLLKQGMNIKKGAIKRWINRNGKPYEEVLMNRVKEGSERLTVDKAYILGVLCGDGYMTTNYRIGLDVRDLDFAEEFKRCIKSVYGLEPTTKKRWRKTNFGEGWEYENVVCSKRLYEDLLRYDPCSFKTHTWIVPEEILQSSDSTLKATFIKGIFDSEGTIRLKKKGHAYLQACSGNEKSVKIVRDMLARDFDINLKVKKRQNLTMIYTERYKDIKKYADTVGFIIKRKRDRLDFCLQNYKRKGIRRYTATFKQRALCLLDQGFSPRQIGRMMNTSHANIYDFLEQSKRKVLHSPQ